MPLPPWKCSPSRLKRPPWPPSSAWWIPIYFSMTHLKTPFLWSPPVNFQPRKKKKSVPSSTFPKPLLPLPALGQDLEEGCTLTVPPRLLPGGHPWKSWVSPLSPLELLSRVSEPAEAPAGRHFLQPEPITTRGVSDICFLECSPPLNVSSLTAGL